MNTLQEILFYETATTKKLCATSLAGSRYPASRPLLLQTDHCCYTGLSLQRQQYSVNHTMPQMLQGSQHYNTTPTPAATTRCKVAETFQPHTHTFQQELTWLFFLLGLFCPLAGTHGECRRGPAAIHQVFVFSPRNHSRIREGREGWRKITREEGLVGLYLAASLKRFDSRTLARRQRASSSVKKTRRKSSLPREKPVCQGQATI